MLPRALMCRGFVIYRPIYNVLQTQLQCRSGSNTAYGAKSEKHKNKLRKFVYNLNEQEREMLIAELNKASSVGKLPADQIETTVPAPTSAQLRYVAIFSGVPFIGFGLLDNTFMLIAGEYIDLTFGAWLGITTMAAAACGNLVSDVLGITTAGFVEQSAMKLGLTAPDVSLEQLSLKRTRWYANIGRCIGVCIGCIIGMWPLWIFNKDKNECKKEEKSKPNELKTE